MSILRAAAPALVLLVSLLGPLPSAWSQAQTEATAEVPIEAPADWDQRRAIALANQLEESMRRAIEAAETAHPQRTAMQQRTRDAALVRMKEAHRYSVEYAEKVRGGWSRDDSEPFFMQLRHTTRLARENARDAVAAPEVEVQLERMDAAEHGLAKLYEQR